MSRSTALTIQFKSDILGFDSWVCSCDLYGVDKAIAGTRSGIVSVIDLGAKQILSSVSLCMSIADNF